VHEWLIELRLGFLFLLGFLWVFAIDGGIEKDNSELPAWVMQRLVDKASTST
jgi:hypothetical protein